MAHSKSCRDHTESRSVICCCCGIKKGRKCVEVTDCIEKLVKLYCNASYYKECPTLPSGVCSYCRRLLFNKARDEKQQISLGKPVSKPPIEPRWSVQWNTIRYVCIHICKL